MIRVRWSRTALENLEAIRLSEYRWNVAMAVRGLTRFPKRGRTPPECELYPDMEFPAQLRELVFPGLVRLFYRFDESRQTIYVLGMAFRGMDVTPDWLLKLKGR